MWEEDLTDKNDRVIRSKGAAKKVPPPCGTLRYARYLLGDTSSNLVRHVDVLKKEIPAKNVTDHGICGFGLMGCAISNLVFGWWLDSGRAVRFGTWFSWCFC